MALSRWRNIVLLSQQSGRRNQRHIACLRDHSTHETIQQPTKTSYFVAIQVIKKAKNLKIIASAFLRFRRSEIHQKFHKHREAIAEGETTQNSVREGKKKLFIASL